MDAISETFRDGIIRISGLIINQYTTDGILQTEKLLDFMKRTGSTVEIFKIVYNWSVIDGLKPIEDLEESEKRELWKRSGRSKDVCKALYLVEKCYKMIQDDTIYEVSL